MSFPLHSFQLIGIKLFVLYSTFYVVLMASYKIKLYHSKSNAIQMLQSINILLLEGIASWLFELSNSSQKAGEMLKMQKNAAFNKHIKLLQFVYDRSSFVL